MDTFVELILVLLRGTRPPIGGLARLLPVIGATTFAGRTAHLLAQASVTTESEQTRLDHQPSFQDHSVLEDVEQTHQESVKDKELAPTL